MQCGEGGGTRDGLGCTPLDHVGLFLTLPLELSQEREGGSGEGALCQGGGGSQGVRDLLWPVGVRPVSPSQEAPSAVCRSRMSQPLLQAPRPRCCGPHTLGTTSRSAHRTQDQERGRRAVRWTSCRSAPHPEPPKGRLPISRRN